MVGVKTDGVMLFGVSMGMLMRLGGAMNASSGINKGIGKETLFLSPQRITITVPAMTLKKLIKRSP